MKEDRAKPEAPAPPQKPLLRDYTETILICVIFVIFSRAFVFQQSKIPSGSMMNTLLVGDYIMVNRFVYAPYVSALEKWLLPIREIGRGDVVVFKHPPTPDQDYIKRVIGIPGDVIELRSGNLFVNDEPVLEPYVEDAYRQIDGRRRRRYGPVTVKDGHYFVMGDHRNSSSDAREWGQVPRELMKGRALLIWWSYRERSICRHGADHGNSCADDATACETGGGTCEPAPVYPTAGQRLRSWGDKLVHFFTRTRWNRCFRVIR